MTAAIETATAGEHLEAVAIDVARLAADLVHKV